MSGRLTISLAALAANYRYLSESCGSRVAGVVKANAYGLGLEPVARELARQHCAEFFVATISEGVVLRDILPTHIIFVLEGADESTRETCLTHQLIPVLNSIEQITCWQGSGQPAALHIDSGMQRLGLAAQDVSEALTLIDFELIHIMSHFARADEQDPALAQVQVQQFEQASRPFRQCFPAAEISMSNSAAACAGGVGEDVVRGGIALYGGNPFSGVDNPMQPVVRLEGRILQLRDAPAGSAVGYGGAFVCPQDLRLATVGIGYADGVPRLLSDRGEVLVGKQRCPIVGRVSMDMLHVDVTALPAVQSGQWVEVMGATIGVDEVAAHATTLGYEILTGLDGARRLERVYSQQLL